MENKKAALPAQWLRARRAVLLYVALVFGLFFFVYALHGYPWQVAGYAALLGLAAGAALAVYDYVRFCAKHTALRQLAGHFPTAPLPGSTTLLQQDYSDIIAALEAERARLQAEGEHVRRDAEEYYTLWAHQIKTPMAAMGLLLQSAKNGIDRQGMATLEQELFRIGQYVEMVLQYQRLSALQNDLVLKRHSLDTLVKAAAKSCAPLFIHKGLPLRLEALDSEITTDEKWFCFVLEQLFTNAVKYTGAGHVRVYMADAETLAVEDTGTGIPQEDIPRVFERGFTGAAGRTERSSTGIGLYLCRQVLARLGFGISIRSALGQGSCVLLHLRQSRLDMME